MVKRLLLISIVGALTAILVATIGALLANKNNNIMQIRKLKQEHYISFFESLHNIVAHPNEQSFLGKYTFYRDKLFIVASEQVIHALIKYENDGVGISNPQHDEILTKLVEAIRADLRIKDKDFPIIGLRVANKKRAN